MRVRRIRLPFGTPLGEKLNRAAELARGETLVKWDDDDYYGPDFLARMTAGRSRAAHAVSFAQPFLVYDVLTRRLCVTDPDRCSGATLTLSRKLWLENPFPAVAHAVDADFLLAVIDRHGTGIGDGRWLGDAFVQVRHDGHLWSRMPDGTTVQEYLASRPPVPRPAERVVPDWVHSVWEDRRREVLSHG